MEREELKVKREREALADQRGCSLEELRDSDFSSSSDGSCTSSGTEGKPLPMPTSKRLGEEQQQKKKRATRGGSNEEAKCKVGGKGKKGATKSKSKKQLKGNKFKACKPKVDARGEVVLTGHKDARLDVTLPPASQFGIMVARIFLDAMSRCARPAAQTVRL